MTEKYKDEIEEILRKAGEVAPSNPPRDEERPPDDGRRVSMVRHRTPVPSPRPTVSRPSITPGKLMLAGVILLFIGIRFWPLIWVGLALLVGAYMMYFVSPRSINYEKRWRGRSVEDKPVSYWDQLKRRLGK